MRRRTLGAAIIAASMASGLLAGCAGVSAKAGGDGGGGTSAGSGGTFTYVELYPAITDWDPAVADSNEQVVMQNVYDTLTRVAPNGKTIEPVLAKSWTHNPGKTLWTFTLRSGATFHTGRPVTAAAVKACIERTIKMHEGASEIWDAVSSIATPDATHIVFKLKYPNEMDVVAAATFGAYIYDVKAQPTSAALNKWFNQGHDAGSGPYEVTAYNRGQEDEVETKAFKNYWGGWSKGSYSRANFNVTPDINTQWQQLQSGQVTFIDNLPPELSAQAKSNGYGTGKVHMLDNLVLLFNTKSGPMSNVWVRRAVQSAINEQGLSEALKGAGEPAASMVPPGLLGATPGINPPYSLATARTDLAKAGYGPGKKHLQVTMTYSAGDTTQQEFATLLNSALEKLNASVSADPMNFNAQYSRATSSNLKNRQDLFLFYWFPISDSAISWFSGMFDSKNGEGYNLAYYSNHAVDAGIARLPVLEATSASQAEATYSSIQHQIVDVDAAGRAILNMLDLPAYASSVHGYVGSPYYPDTVFVHDIHAG
jgi:peptide/nickel transport system substrate-binding protein